MDARTALNQKFFDLNVGEVDTDSLTDVSLEAMIEKLEKAQVAGLLNLETAAGIENLKNIVNLFI